MILSKALQKDLWKGIFFVLFILLLLFLSNKFVSLVQKAAAGVIPPGIITKVLVLTIPESILLLTPLATFLATVFVFSAWVTRHEWTAAQISGFSPRKALSVLCRVYGIIGLVLLLFNLLCMASVQRFKEEILAEGQQDFFTELKEETFYHRPEFPFVVYAKEKSGTLYKEVLLFQIPNRAALEHGVEVTSAKSATLSISDDRMLAVHLENGQDFFGVPGKKDFRVTEFQGYERHFKIPLPEIPELRRTTSTAALIHSKDLGDKGELSFRIALPLAAFILGLMGFPLSMSLPRQSYFVKVLPCLVVFLCYMNFLSAARKWIEIGAVSPWVGGSAIHLIALLILVGLYRRQFGK